MELCTVVLAVQMCFEGVSAIVELIKLSTFLPTGQRVCIKP